jgi:selenocysteine lyase/cysteine desulfurase
MMLLTAEHEDGTVSLVIVLGDDNIERIKQYDQAEVQWRELPWKYSSRQPHTIAVAYATPQEMQIIEQLAREGKQQQAMELVTRGFQFRPDRGDHDRGPQIIR